jgi:3-phosphoshikimate 1-carboxyvinyltransferase
MTIQFNKHELKGEVHLPSSKSISNRVLMIRELCTETFEINNIATSSDTKILIENLQTIRNSESNFIDLHLHDAGTPFRFLTAFACLQKGKTIYLHGNERMHKRPIAELVDALRQLGATIEYEQQEGYPPIIVYGGYINGGIATISSSISSQFISALCLLAPSLKFGLELSLTGEAVSSTYTEMTLKLMQEFGIHYKVQLNNYHQIESIKIEPQTYQPKKFHVSSDWSSACFFYAMAMICELVELRLLGLHADGLQGDEMISHFTNTFGIQTEINENGITITRIHDIYLEIEQHFSLHDYPDLAVPLIVACAIKYPNCSFEGIHHLELKESKRITALQNELRKVDIELIYENGILRIQHHKKTQQIKFVTFQSYNDHRIVMALSLFALIGYEVSFDSVTCIQKSFPDYFNELSKLG